MDFILTDGSSHYRTPWYTATLTFMRASVVGDAGGTAAHLAAETPITLASRGGAGMGRGGSAVLSVLVRTRLARVASASSTALVRVQRRRSSESPLFAPKKKLLAQFASMPEARPLARVPVMHPHPLAASSGAVVGIRTRRSWQSTSRSTGPRSREAPAEETHHAPIVAGDLSSAWHHAGAAFLFPCWATSQSPDATARIRKWEGGEGTVNHEDWEVEDVTGEQDSRSGPGRRTWRRELRRCERIKLCSFQIRDQQNT